MKKNLKGVEMGRQDGVDLDWLQGCMEGEGCHSWSIQEKAYTHTGKHRSSTTQQGVNRSTRAPRNRVRILEKQPR